MNTGMFSVVFPENSSATYFTILYKLCIICMLYDNYNMDMSGLPNSYICTPETQRLRDCAYVCTYQMDLI